MTLKVPDGVKIQKRGSCVPVAMLMAQHLTAHSSLGETYVIEGYVRFRTNWQQHTWMEIDGQIFDPTLAQFKRFIGFPDARRKETKRMRTAEYIPLARSAAATPFWNQRLRMFGISPEEVTA